MSSKKSIDFVRMEGERALMVVDVGDREELRIMDAETTAMLCREAYEASGDSGWDEAAEEIDHFTRLLERVYIELGDLCSIAWGGHLEEDVDLLDALRDDIGVEMGWGDE